MDPAVMSSLIESGITLAVLAGGRAVSAIKEYNPMP